MQNSIYNQVENVSFCRILNQLALFIKGVKPNHVFKSFVQVPQVYANLVQNNHVDLVQFDSSISEMLQLAEIIVSKAVLICACQVFYDNKLTLEDHIQLKKVPKATYCPFLDGICKKGTLNEIAKNADQHDYPYFWYGVHSKEVHFSPSARTSFDVVVFYDETGKGVVDQSYRLSTHLCIQALSRMAEFHLDPDAEELFWFVVVESNIPLERDINGVIPCLAGDLSFFRNLLD
jgi:hypothetical protein